MKHRILKVVACISLVAMVLSAMMPGALADDTVTTDVKEFGERPMRDGPRGNPGMNDGGPMEEMEFGSDEEEMEFLVERHTERINNQIEMLNVMLENIENAGTLDELKEILSEGRKSMMPGMKGEKPEMEAMEFESDEDEMEFIVEKETDHINNIIEMLSEKLNDLDEDSDEYEAITEEIEELEALLENIEEATTLDDLKEIMEEHRENNPHPGHGGERGHGPMENEVNEE